MHILCILSKHPLMKSVPSPLWGQEGYRSRRNRRLKLRSGNCLGYNHVTEAGEKITKEFWGKPNLVLSAHSHNSTTAEMQVVYLSLKYINIHVFYRWLVGATVWKYGIIILLKKTDILFTLKAYPEVSDTSAITPWTCLPDKMSWFYKWCLFSHVHFFLVSLIFAQNAAVGVLDHYIH